MVENGKPVELPRVIPSDRAWFDPRLLLAATRLVRIDVTPVSGSIVPLLPADPSRLAFFVAGAVNDLVQRYISPVPDVDNFQFARLTDGLVRVTLFDYPGLVQGPWFVKAMGVGNLVVMTCVRNG